MPVYAFIHRDILAVLPVWQANPNATFDGIVDSPRLFDFVVQVRSADRVWTFPFDTAQDIIAALRVQFAYQMNRGLTLLRQLDEGPPELQRLHGSALRVAAEQPKGWQALLLAELLEQHLAEFRQMKQDHARGFTAGPGEHVVLTDFSEWLSVSTDHGQRIAQQLTETLNSVVNTACFGDDVAGIIYGADRVAISYREALEWAGRLRRAHVPETLRTAVSVLSRFLDSILAQVEQMPGRLRRTIAEMVTSGAARAQLGVTLNIDPALTEAFSQELKRAKRSLRL